MIKVSLLYDITTYGLNKKRRWFKRRRLQYYFKHMLFVIVYINQKKNFFLFRKDRIYCLLLFMALSCPSKRCVFNTFPISRDHETCKHGLICVGRSVVCVCAVPILHPKYSTLMENLFFSVRRNTIWATFCRNERTYGNMTSR